LIDRGVPVAGGWGWGLEILWGSIAFRALGSQRHHPIQSRLAALIQLNTGMRI
jgi:hypothetical protein